MKTPTVRFTHRGINPFDEINKVNVYNMKTILDPKDPSN